MSTEIKIALIVVAVILFFLLLYCNHTKKKYGRSPISKIGIALETLGALVPVALYSLNSNGRTNNEMALIAIVVLAISVIVSIVLCIRNCKKLGIRIGGTILGALFQIAGVLLIIPEMIIVFLRLIVIVSKASNECK